MQPSSFNRQQTALKEAFKYYIIRLGGGVWTKMIILIMFPWGWGVWDLNDDDDDGTISSKNKKAAAMIYHPLLMIFLIKVTLYISTSWNL